MVVKARCTLLVWALAALSACQSAGTPNLTPSAAVRVAALPRELILVGSGKAVSIRSPNDCAALGSQFLIDWCTLFAAGDLAAVTQPDSALAQTPTTYAYLALKLVANADAFCSDSTVIAWYRLSPRAGADPSAGASCGSYVAQVKAQGYFEVSDPGSGATVRVQLK